MAKKIAARRSASKATQSQKEAAVRLAHTSLLSSPNPVVKKLSESVVKNQTAKVAPIDTSRTTANRGAAIRNTWGMTASLNSAAGQSKTTIARKLKKRGR